MYVCGAYLSYQIEEMSKSASRYITSSWKKIFIHFFHKFIYTLSAKQKSRYCGLKIKKNSGK